jgi:peptidase E
MDKKIFLLGGGEISERETETIDREALAARKKPGTIVFIGAAAGDSEGYYECFKNYYASMCDDKDFAMLKSTASAEEAREVLLGASLVYLGGGSTEALYETLEKWGGKELLEEVSEAGVVLIGLSAGAYVLAKGWRHFEDGKVETGPGFNLVDVIIECHSTDESRKAIIEQTDKNFISLRNCEYYSC